MTSEPVRTREWVIRAGTTEDLPPIEPLWLALYKNEREFGNVLEIPANAYQEWAKAMSLGLQRFSCIFVAVKDAEVIGFVSGWRRTLPAYHGGTPAGFLTEMYVNDGYRSQGIGHALLETGAQFFHDQGVERIEGQVLESNSRARKAYRAWGWTEEYIKILWKPTPEGRALVDDVSKLPVNTRQP